MNLAIAIYCLLSGPLLIWDWFQRRKLAKQRDNAYRAIAVLRIAGRLSSDLNNELLERIYWLEEQLEGSTNDAEDQASS